MIRGKRLHIVVFISLLLVISLFYTFFSFAATESSTVDEKAEILGGAEIDDKTYVTLIDGPEYYYGEVIRFSFGTQPELLYIVSSAGKEYSYKKPPIDALFKPEDPGTYKGSASFTDGHQENFFFNVVEKNPDVTPPKPQPVKPTPSVEPQPTEPEPTTPVEPVKPVVPFVKPQIPCAVSNVKWADQLSLDFVEKNTANQGETVKLYAELNEGCSGDVVVRIFKRGQLSDEEVHVQTVKTDGRLSLSWIVPTEEPSVLGALLPNREYYFVATAASEQGIIDIVENNLDMVDATAEIVLEGIISERAVSKVFNDFRKIRSLWRRNTQETGGSLAFGEDNDDQSGDGFSSGESESLIVSGGNPPVVGFSSGAAQINFQEVYGISRDQIVSFNFPLAEGELFDLANNFHVLDDQGVPVPAQLSVKSRWNGEPNDNTASIKWVHIDMPVQVSGGMQKSYSVDYGPGVGSPPAPPTVLSVAQNGNNYIVNTGVAEYVLNSNTFNLFDTVMLNGQLFANMEADEGIELVEDSVTRLEATVGSGSTQLQVVDTEAFSVNDQVEITIKHEIANDTGPASVTNWFITKGLSTDLQVGDQITLSKGTNREETVLVTSIEQFDNPHSYSPPTSPNDSLKFTVSPNFQYKHYVADTFELSQPITATVQQINGQNSMTVSPLARGAFADSQIRKPNSPRVFSPRYSTPTTFTVEENGPIRSVIYVEGNLDNQQGQTLLRYQARLTFYAGESFVKVRFVRWNTGTYGFLSHGPNEDVFIKSNSVELPFDNQANTVTFDTSTFSGTPGGVSGSLSEQTVPFSSGDTVRQYVTIKVPPSRDVQRLNAPNDPTSHNIYDNMEGEILLNSNSLYSAGGNPPGGSPLYNPIGVALMSNGAGKNLAVGVQDFWERSPKDIVVNEDKVTLGFTLADQHYGPNTDVPAMHYFNQEGGSRLHYDFIYYPIDGNPSFGQVRDKIRSYLHLPLRPEMIDHVHSTQAAFYFPYVLKRQDWNAPGSPVTAPLSDTYNHYENWHNVLFDNSYVTGNGVSSVWDQERVIGAAFGNYQFYGENTVRQWAAGPTDHYDFNAGLQVQFLRSGDTRLLDWARRSVEHRTFYRTNKPRSSTASDWEVDLEAYEKGTKSHRDFFYAEMSHSWYEGSHLGCMLLDEQWACDNMRDWAEGHLLGGHFTSGNWISKGSCSSGHGMRRLGWTAIGGVAAYLTFGKQEYLDSVESLYLQCAQQDMNQAGGPRGVIPSGGIVDVWKNAILMRGATSYIMASDQPRQEILDYVQRYADWVSDYHGDPYTNPHGIPYAGNTGPNSNYLPYNVCQTYDYNVPAGGSGGCTNPGRANNALTAQALALAYAALLPYPNMAREEWADLARDITETSIKWNNMPNSITVDRYDPTDYAPVGGRISQYYATPYKSHFNVMYSYNQPSMYVETALRLTCEQQNGAFCTSAQVCNGNYVTTSNSGGQSTCCLPTTGASCISDLYPPYITNILPNYNLHVSTQSFDLSFDTYDSQTNNPEEAECRYSEQAGVSYANMPHTFGGSGTSQHSITVNSYGGQPVNYPNGATLDFHIICGDLPTGNLMASQLVQVTINPPDVTAPVISATVVTPGENSVDASWTTDELATTEMTIYENGQQVLQSIDPTLTLSHSVSFPSGLNPSTHYDYIIASEDQDQNRQEVVGTLTTLNQQVNLVLTPSQGATIASGPNGGYGTYGNSFFAGWRSTWYHNSRLQLLFDLSNLPPATSNMQATLSFEIANLDPASTNIPVSLSVYPLTTQSCFANGGSGQHITGSSNWFFACEPTVSWNTLGGDYETNTNVYTPVTYSVSGVNFPTTVNLDVAALVQYWLNGNTNHGLIVVGPPNTQPLVWITHNGANQPTLTITGETLPVNPTGAVCGNSICENGENCGNCIGDCPCNSGEVCQNNVCTVPAPVCGNGIPETGEQCDTGMLNGIACTPAYGQTCTYCDGNCNNQVVVGPSCGDGTCNGPENCGSCSQDCSCTGTLTCQNNQCVLPAPVCGNSILELGEECDLGSANGQVCTPAYGSTCTYCDATCTSVTLTGPSCGDGTCNGPENCGTCNQDCACTGGLTCQNNQCSAPAAVCGNGVPEQGEQCDNGASNGVACSAPYGGSCNYCSASCTTVFVTGEFCGDDICNGPENCATCTNDCNCASNMVCTSAQCILPPAVCGNGIREGNEDCDDGSNNGLVCIPPYGGTCTYCDMTCNTVTVTGEFCGDGTCNGLENCGSCSQDCSCTGGQTCQNNVCTAPTAVCGNGIPEQGEQCDDGNNNGVMCSAPYGGTCTYCDMTCNTVTVTGEFCGDGSCNGNEDCGTCSQDCACLNGQQCQNNICTTPSATCGNGVPEPGEDCDDGQLNGIACSAAYNQTCTYCDGVCKMQTVIGPYCGDGVCNGPETQQLCPSDCGGIGPNGAPCPGNLPGVLAASGIPAPLSFGPFSVHLPGLMTYDPLSGTYTSQIPGAPTGVTYPTIPPNFASLIALNSLNLANIEGFRMSTAEADIVFLENVTLTHQHVGTSGAVQNCTALNFSSTAQFVPELVNIDSTNLPGLDKAAEITFRNIAHADPRPTRDGQACPNEVCNVISHDPSAQLFTFRVPGFSSYGVEQTPPPDPGGGGTGGGGSAGSGSHQSVQHTVNLEGRQVDTEVIQVTRNDQVTFVMGNAEYSFWVDAVTSRHIRLRNMNTHETNKLDKGQEYTYDLDQDDSVDVYLTLFSVVGTRGSLELRTNFVTTTATSGESGEVISDDEKEPAIRRAKERDELRIPYEIRTRGRYLMLILLSTVLFLLGIFVFAHSMIRQHYLGHSGPHPQTKKKHFKHSGQAHKTGKVQTAKDPDENFPKY